MNGTPTIILASLSDDKLKESINSLVKHVNEKMEEMVESTNSAVKRMEDKLKSLGNLKIDSGGTNDGGTGRRTQQHEKLTKAVNDASEAVSKETQKLQDLQQSLSGASDREQNFTSQKERAANTIAQENELLGKQQSELAALKVQQQSLVDSEQRDIQAKQQNAAAIEKQRGAVKYYEEEIVSLQARLTSAQAKIDRFYEVQAKARESISSRLHAPSDQFIGYNDYERGKSVYSKTEQDVRSLIKALSELDNADKKHGFGDELRRAYMNLTPSQDMANVFKRQQEEISSYIKTLQEAKKGTKGETRVNLDNQILAGKELLAIYKELGNAQNALNKTVQKEGLRDGGNVGGIKRDIDETQKAYDIAKRKLDELTQSSQQSTQASQQKAQIDAQVAAKEKEIAETKGRIAAATKEQSEADKNASQAAKEKANIQSQVTNQEKQVAEAKKQLTTATQQHTDAETKSSRATKEKTMTLDQQASAINTVVQSEKKYTDEILRQAAAIRSSKEWQEKGHVIIGDVNYYNKERANVSKRDKQLLLSLEEQIVQAQQKEAQEALVAAEANRQKAQAAKDAAQAMRGISSYDLGIDPNVSAGRQRQIELTRKASQGTEYLRQQVASLLEVEEREVKSVNMTTASYSELSQHLKQLQSAYNKLGADRIKKGEGVDIANEIQRTQRAMQKLQQTMSRPVSLKDALGGSEKTLDDIAHKMQRLSSYRSGLNVETQTKEIDQVNRKYAELQKKMNEVMEKNSQMASSNNILANSWRYMRNRLAFYFTVGASTQFVKNLIEVRSQYEMNERALGILINSAERGTQIFNELSQMALVSPYTLIELSSAAKQLTAYDVAAKDVVDTTRRLADMAAAVGIPIERLTYALGQIKAYGYLNSRDARMFANAGIPLVKQLSDYYTELEGKLVSTADVYDRIKKKAIDYNEVMEVINKMTDEGGKFFDFQSKMAETLKVQLANLTLAWNNMLNDIGASEQGTISTGIGLLKELFLEWKNISKMVTNLATGFGIVKAAQLAYYGVVMGTNKAIALETVLGNRLSKNLRSLASSTNAASMSSTALWVGIATFAAAAVVDILRGNEAMKEFNKTLRENAENTYNDLKKFSENYSSLRESLYKTENGKQTPVDINSEEAKKAWEVLREQIELSSHASDEYISKLLSIENVSERLRQGFAVIDSIQAVSAAIKEIGDSAIKLERDWSAWWNLGLLPDGTIGNLQDAYMWLSKIEEKYGSVVNARKVASTSRTDEGFKNVFQDEANEFVENYETELEKFRKDLQVTKQSIIDFIELKGWSGDTSKINEVFKTFTDNLILKNQLNPQQAYTLQLEMEEARSKAAKQAQYARAKDLERAYYIEKNKQHKEELAKEYEKEAEIYNNWDNFNGRKKVEWERFTKWLKEQHISETTAMFRNMDAEDIKSLNFQEGKHAEWVTRMVTQYAKEHKMSYDEAFKYLKSWVRNANQWSIFIPLTISNEDKKSVYEQLGEYDKAVDEADAQIERLTKRIGELNAKKKKSKEETKELTNAEKELTQAQKNKADAEAKGGHGKKEKKNERAANKAAKQAESELQKALKDELSTIDKVRSIYKDLTKEGMSHADAVERATRGWNETVSAINKVLQKNGLQKLDLSKFAGIENPRELVNILQSQLNTLLKRGAKPAEIKELQTKIQTLNVDADKYDLTRITKGLNSELDKLKDEYELALELDANPELGGMFLDMFGIDTTDFPKTIDEYMNRAQQEFDKMRKKRNFSAPLNIFKAGDKEWEEWGRQVGLVVDVLDENGNVIDKNTDALDKLTPKFKEAQGVAKKWAQDTVKATKDLEYELGDLAKKVEIEEAKLAVLEDEAANETNAKQKHLLELQIQKQKEAIEKLKMESVKLLPFYEDLFGDMYNVSVGRLKEIAKAAKEVMTPRKGEDGVGYVQRTDSKGNVVFDIFSKDKQGNIKKTTISLEEYIKINKQIDSVQQKIAESSPWEKIKDSFSKKNGGGLKNFASGMETIGGELQKIANITKEIGGFAEALGADDETVEIINDVATSIDGVATAAQGIGQIAKGDYIGGAASVLSGAISAISTWFDNSDKKITAKIESSERTVKRLEIAYQSLEHAVNEAYGTATIGAQKAAIANKELQLAELKRQLALEQSRKGKNKDQDKILDLQGQIISLEYEIKDATDQIVNDLLGISSVGDALENVMGNIIESFRSGSYKLKDIMKDVNVSFNDMIANMVMKMYTTKILKPWFEEQWNKIKKVIDARGADETETVTTYQNLLTEVEGKSEEYVQSRFGKTKAELIEFYKNKIAEAEKELQIATTPTTDDIKQFAEILKSGQPITTDQLKEIQSFLMELGVLNDKKKTTLSALQAGISGITETTAESLEAYMNGVSQQVYLQSDILTQIRDAVVGFDIDVQTATMGNILLQLRSSYEVQTAIKGILEGVLTPSGRSFSVELAS